MEKLLSNIVLLNEISILAQQVETASELVNQTPNMSNIVKKTAEVVANNSNNTKSGGGNNKE